jgi:hypothetical protein
VQTEGHSFGGGDWLTLDRAIDVSVVRWDGRVYWLGMDEPGGLTDRKVGHSPYSRILSLCDM